MQRDVSTAKDHRGKDKKCGEELGRGEAVFSTKKFWPHATLAHNLQPASPTQPFPVKDCFLQGM